MTEEEVIRKLKEHLKAMEIKFGGKTNKDLHWALQYVQDFLLIGRKEAIKFIEENVLDCSFEQCKKEWSCYSTEYYKAQLRKRKQQRSRCSEWQ